jgi:hypothetical protein
MKAHHMSHSHWSALAVLTVLSHSLFACGQKVKTAAPGPDVQIVDESWRWMKGAALPTQSDIFNGDRVSISMAKGERYGLQILSTQEVSSQVNLPAPLTVKAMKQGWVNVTSGSTVMYGTGHRGAGSYADTLSPIDAGAVFGQAALFDIWVPVETPAGVVKGTIVVGNREIPLQINVRNVGVNIRETPRVWAYYDPREIAWQFADAQSNQPEDMDALGQRCEEMFREHGVLGAPTLNASEWPAYKARLRGSKFIPVEMRSVEPQEIATIVKDWVDLTKGTDQLPFAIPIDEPRAEARAKVKAASAVVREQRGDNKNFLFAVTADPNPDFGDAIDLYFSLYPKREQARTLGAKLFTYNGKPPHAGSMVVDAAPMSMRTWGVIGHRYGIDLWYIWDGLYWHDRHNRDKSKDVKGGKVPLGRKLNVEADARSFRDREDDGNLDGVVAHPDAANGCAPSLRLKQLRRGLYDRALIDAANCQGKGDKIAALLVPAALGDVESSSKAQWPSDPLVWNRARLELFDEAEKCAAKAP